MNVRSPYMISMFGHVMAFGLVLLLSALSRPTVFISGVNIVLPAPGSGREGGGPATIGAPEESAEKAPEKIEEPEPPPEPPPTEPERPQPEMVVPKEPDPDGTLPPAKDVIVPSDRGAPQQLPEAPESVAVADDAGDAGNGTGIGVEGGVLGAHAPWYLMQMRDKIAANWHPPAGIGRVGHAVARLHFRVHPDGSITDVEVLDASGTSLYDRAAMRSIFNSAPLPPLPEEVGTETIGITLTFKQRY